MYMQDEKILKEIQQTRNISKSTYALYRIVIMQYSEMNNKTMYELILEAEEEEEERIRWKKRKIKKRLLKYRSFLYNKYLHTTAKRYFTCICAVYRDYDIEVQKLPPISQKNINKNKPINYQDLPDADVIKKVLNITNVRNRAIILFLASSGCGRTEACNITIQDYINATSEYHNSNDIYEVLQTLTKKENIVPQFELFRKKTSKHYITFCTPEATNAINIYLNSKEDEIHNNDLLFGMGPNYMNEIFYRLNNKLNLGKIGTYNRFRPHMLRKFHASRLHNDGMSIDVVDSLQGRSKDSIHKAYFLEDPLKLKDDYIKHMGAVMIEWNYNSLTFKSEEYVELEMENIRKTRELDDLSVRLKSIESFVFRGMSKRDVEDMEGWL